MSSKKKKQQIRPDRLSSSKQKDSVQKAIQKNAKTLERRLQKIGETTKPQQMKQIRFPVPKSLALHNRYPIMGQNIQLERNGRILLINSDFQFSLGKKSRLSAKMVQVRQPYWNISANKEKESSFRRK